MFKAFHRNTGQEIILLDMDREQVERTRAIGHDHKLGCPHCQLDLIVKAGEIRIWHFAHWVKNKRCPASGTGELLKARAVLYRWLQDQFRGTNAKVNVEHMPADLSVHRPVDCWVETATGRKYAFWVFEKTGLRGERARVIQHGLGENVVLVPVFLSQLMERLDPAYNVSHKRDHLRLSPTEERFIKGSKYDSIYAFTSCYGSLHYLDATGEVPTLKTFRALRPYKERATFRGVEVTTPFVNATFSDGHFVHPAEQTMLQQAEDRERTKREQAERERLEEERRRGRTWQQRTKINIQPIRRPAWAPNWPNSEKVAPPQPTFTEREGTCIKCGQRTRDWISFDGATLACKCRTCFGQQSNG